MNQNILTTSTFKLIIVIRVYKIWKSRSKGKQTKQYVCWPLCFKYTCSGPYGFLETWTYMVKVKKNVSHPVRSDHLGICYVPILLTVWIHTRSGAFAKCNLNSESVQNPFTFVCFSGLLFQMTVNFINWFWNIFTEVFKNEVWTSVLLPSYTAPGSVCKWRKDDYEHCKQFGKLAGQAQIPLWWVSKQDHQRYVYKTWWLCGVRTYLRYIGQV